MADTAKVLGQVAPLATTLTAVYTVPALTQAVLSTVSVCNRGGTATTYRLSVAVAGAVDDVKQYVVYDAPLAANETKTHTLGLTLGAADVLRAFAGNGNVSVGAFGIETA